MSSTYNLEHDIQRLIDYIKLNWRSTNVEAPDDIYYNQSIGEDLNRVRCQVIRHWMFQNCIEFEEDPTNYSLLDMRGNADRENDTVFKILCYSKLGSHRAIRMFNECLYHIQHFPYSTSSNHYEFTQILDSAPTRDPYTGRVYWNILLSRRGKGHVS